jgi:hypothetical protein
MIMRRASNVALVAVEDVEQIGVTRLVARDAQKT